ncbi:uncharacterized protein DS421_10g308790 [Arachis hypogaea]|nr:uncharacterized protein DS421_10g308790 [Arachis hypogaea]
MLNTQRKKETAERKGRKREKKRGRVEGEERETAPVGITATVAAAVLSGGRSEEERERVELREQRNTLSPSSRIAIIAGAGRGVVAPLERRRHCWVAVLSSESRERARGRSLVSVVVSAGPCRRRL